jgi:hypothetical protein
VKNKISIFLILIFIGLFANSFAIKSFALDLEPGRWNHLPIGINVAGIGYAYTESDIHIDPALLIENVEMEMDTYVGKYIRTFELFGKSARLDLTQGYQEGKWAGLVDGVSASISRNGLTDSFLRVAVNLYGAPPLKGKAFANYKNKMAVETIVGAGMAVRLPTGDYMEDKLINLGKNRFAFRPQIGVVHSRGKWTAELSGEVAFYTENDEFYNGNTFEQKPLYFVTGHLRHTFRPGLWISASMGYDYGGESSVNGIDKNDRRQDIAWALSAGYPINRSLGIQIAYASSRTQEAVGFDSDTVILGLAFSW